MPEEINVEGGEIKPTATPVKTVGMVAVALAIAAGGYKAGDLTHVDPDAVKLAEEMTTKETIKAQGVDTVRAAHIDTVWAVRTTYNERDSSYTRDSTIERLQPIPAVPIYPERNIRVKDMSKGSSVVVPVYIVDAAGVEKLAGIVRWDVTRDPPTGARHTAEIRVITGYEGK